MYSSLPPLLSTISKLEELHLSSHQLLNSSLPAELAALQQLRVLHLAGPGVQGGVVLPAAWGQLQKLQSLWLLNLGGSVAGNALSGQLPEWLVSVMGGSDAAVMLNLNTFTGPIPAAWGFNVSATFRLFSLANNLLTGNIPDSLASLAYSSSVFDLSSNKLQGALGPNWYNVTSQSSPRLSYFGSQNNPCLCGGLPYWAGSPPPFNSTDTYPNGTIAPANMTANTSTAGNSTTNSTSQGNTTTVGNTTTSAAAGVNVLGTIWQPCGTPESDAVCGQSLYPPEFFSGAQELLALKAAAADPNTQMRLSSWRFSIPPCTNYSSSANAACVLCDEQEPQSNCGKARPIDGQVLCNWRFVECRGRQVVAVNMARKGLIFNSLPAALAGNGTRQLEVMDLSGSTVMGGVLPAEFAGWSNLTVFRVQGPLSGPLPANYSSLTRLRAFDISNTKLTGTIPEAYFSSWLQLENFTIDGASFDGQLPPPWQCANLRHYIVQNTPVVSNATHPVWVLDARAANLTQMTGLGLGGTQLQLPSWTNVKEALRRHNWTSVQRLSLPSMNLTGPIGPLVYYLPQLAMLDLSSNQLSGVLPPDLSAAYSSLLHVNLSSNALYVALDLSRNRLSGPLPDIGNTSSSPANASAVNGSSVNFTSSANATIFWRFSLAGNQFTGSIPDSYAALMISSGHFDFSNLPLSGQLPAALFTAAVNASTFSNRGKSLRFTNSSCLCGPMPSWLLNFTLPDGTSGTGLGAACNSSCTPTIAGPTTHQDWPGLLSLKSAIIGASTPDIAAKYPGWGDTSKTPCHDVDPNCKLCPWQLPIQTCGTQVQSAGNGTVTGPPSYYCNAFGVACSDGRVTTVNISGVGLVLKGLPGGFSQLTMLRELDMEGNTVSQTSSLPDTWLQVVSLANNSLQGSLNSSAWHTFASLCSLNLSSNRITGALQASWSALRTNLSIDLSYNNITGPLPAGLAAAGADGRVLQLALLNVSRNSITGTLPASYANLSAAVPTALVLSYNQLQGGIPDAWAARNSSGLSYNNVTSKNMTSLAELDVANNSRMCGVLPSWFHERFTRSSLAAAARMVQGTALGDSCQPATFQHFFNTLGAAVPTVGRPITLQLLSKTSLAAVAAVNGSWQVSVTPPAGGAAVPLGGMQQWQNTSTSDYVWRFVVPSGVINTVGTYTFSVANPANSSMLASNSPMSVIVFPAVSAADISRLAVFMPALAVGGIASCSLQVLEANGTPRATANGTALVVQGFWSSSNGSFVVPFKLPSNVTYSGQLQIRQSNASTAPFATRDIAFNVSQLYAAAANSSLAGFTTGRAGDPLVVVAALRSTVGRPVFTAENVRVTVTGNISGAIALPPLARQPDNTWTLTLTPKREEALALRMTIDSQTAASQAIVISGRSLSFLALNASLQQASLVSQGLAATSLITEGALLMVYLEEASYAYVPIFDKAGVRVTADPKLTALLSLVPSSLEASILQQYSLAPAANTTAAAPQTIARRALLADTLLAPEHQHLRSLLQANSSNSTSATAPATSNSTFASPAPKPSPSPVAAGQIFNSSSTAPVGWTYLSDYETEPPSINMFDAPAPLPANYTFEQLASPDGGNAVQDWLPLNASITTYQVSMPDVVVARYAGGSAKALSDFTAVVAAKAALDGASWVQAAALPGTTLVINATMWFPSNFANVSSPFEGLSALDYFAFLLSKLPAVAFSSDSYPALVAANAKVTNFTVTLPGRGSMDGFAYAAASTTTSSSSSSSSSTAPSSSTGTTSTTLRVVDIQASQLQVVVATPISGSNSSTPTPPPIDLSKIIDTSPPVITLSGSPYMSILQADRFSDPGATAYDNIDGNGVTVITRLQLCSRPSGIESAAATDSRRLTCGAALPLINTLLPTASNATFVFAYTARDVAGNQAVPLRRYVVVTSR
ncbi:hypothetical protein OEZ86_009906 [Tetradesmus obliquus]|uniref:GP46-like surface antigen n=1 Tax=Tetradesmus obliquus TaxID=3088 RepID=A0ABY8UQN6_TETOB|nr:hypothetical protein OEZ85_001343 [Tetradesmus obliquus]WIA43438.1 hypothetical protein OEZ86_009906 [Tetradesmus obliquus]